MSCFRCSSGCVPEPDGSGCGSDTFVEQDACTAWCATSSGWTPGFSPSPSRSPSRPPSPSPETQSAILKAHNDFRREAGFDPLRWDPALEGHAKSWARELIDRCDDVGLLDGGVPGRNVTKVSGAPEPFLHTWPQVVGDWLYEGCQGDFWKASRQEQEASYAHFMTATLKDQRTVGCAQIFTPDCKNLGSSLQAFVCEYGLGAPQRSEGLYPPDPRSQKLCQAPQPFPVRVE